MMVNSSIYVFLIFICGAFPDLASCAHFKNREKDTWSSVTFSKVAGFTVFKLYERYQIEKRTTFGYIFHRFISFKAWQVIVVIPQKFVFLFRKAYHIIIILLLSF